MWWRLSRSQFADGKGEGNRLALRRLVKEGEVPGLLAYAQGEPVAWCALGPREAYPALERSRVLKRVDDAAVWSVVCFFVAKPFRRRGLTVTLLEAAVDHVRDHGGTIVEGYPVEPKTDRIPDDSAFMGLPSAFRAADFTELLRRSETRPILRYAIP
jgi:GNAT superfamily N-acetyltransferase